MHHRSFARDKLKRQAHALERQQKIGKNNGGIDAELFRGGNRHFGGKCGLLADFNERVVTAHSLVFRHVAPGLPQKPHRRTVYRAAKTSAYKARRTRRGLTAHDAETGSCLKVGADRVGDRRVLHE